MAMHRVHPVEDTAAYHTLVQDKLPVTEFRKTRFEDIFAEGVDLLASSSKETARHWLHGSSRM
eukprot:5838553-Amphidinium_carterae.1